MRSKSLGDVDMSKKFEEAYKEYLNSQAPDLWGRINDRLDAKQQDCLGRMADDNVAELRRLSFWQFRFCV